MASGLLLLAIVGLSLRCAHRAGSPLDGIDRWWIYIGHGDDPREFDWRQETEGIGLVVLNDDPRIPLTHLSPRTIRLAYLSVGEAEVIKPYWREVERMGITVEPNPHWPGNVRVDLRDRRWQELLLHREAPRLLRQGFHGFMLDTVDTAAYLEAKDPVRFAGCRQALVRFVAELRSLHPRAVVLANGAGALPDLAPHLDGVVTEGLFATYDFDRRLYRETTREERAWRLAQVEAALARRRLPVFAIEYAPPTELGLGRWAARQAQRRGFKPFVAASIELGQLPRTRLATDGGRAERPRAGTGKRL